MNTKLVIVIVVLLGVVAVGLQYYFNNYAPLGGAAVFGPSGADQAACSGICQESCTFSNPTDTQQCLQQCAQFCAQGY